LPFDSTVTAHMNTEKMYATACNGFENKLNKTLSVCAHKEGGRLCSSLTCDSLLVFLNHF